jgi:hypothetical protein
MNCERLRVVVLQALLTLLLSTGCAKTYAPALTLPASDKTIDAVVEFHPLNATSSLLSGRDTFGVFAKKVDTPSPGQLTEQISTALEDSFASDHVFRRLVGFDQAPDLILTGRIDKFYEHDRPRLWTYIPQAKTVATLFRMNTYVSSGAVDLTMFLMRPTGKLMGQYHSRQTFDETYRPNSDMSPGARLNRAFSEAIQDIRDKIIADPELAKERLSK